MNNLLPGVHFSQSMVEPEALPMPTAVPVFIGYTEMGEAQTLYAIDSFADYKKQLENKEPSPLSDAAARCVLHHTVKHYFDNGGDPCFVLSVNTYESLGDKDLTDLEDLAKIKEELTHAQLFVAIKKESTITLAAMPDVVLLDVEKGRTFFKEVWQAMVTQLCSGQIPIFCLLDVPADPQAANTCLESLQDAPKLDRAEHAAAYWPHLTTEYRDTDAEKEKVLPPSGAVAAAIQRTDNERGVWKAPANVPLYRVIKPQYSYLDAASFSTFFHKDSVSFNLIRSFQGRGVRIWGCRTLSDDVASPWRYVQTRRLVSYVESNLREVARFAVFEPNNAMTWGKLKGLCRVWLRELWRNGGLLGEFEEEAFQVLVGKDESMTAADIQSGKLIVRIGLALHRAAEFIYVQLQFNVSENPADTITSHKSLLL